MLTEKKKMTQSNSTGLGSTLATKTNKQTNKRKPGSQGDREGGWGSRGGGGAQVKKDKGKKLGGRKGRERKKGEEREISVECLSEPGWCQRDRASTKPCLWFPH